MRRLWVSLLCATVAMAAVHGDSWFNAGVANLDDWPTDGSDKVLAGAGTWRNTLSAVLLGEAGVRRLQLGATREHPLEFEPAVVRSAERVVTVSFGIQFSAGSLPTEVDPMMKGAVTVVSAEATGSAETYYGLVGDSAGGANVWVPLTGATPDTEREVTVGITVRKVEGVYQVRYTVDGVALQTSSGDWAEIVFPNDDGDVVAMGCYGTGQISALSGATEMAQPTVGLTIPVLDGLDVASVSVGGMEITPDENGVYAVPQGDTVAVTFKPADGYVLGAGAMTFTMTASGELPTEGRPVPIAVETVLSINEIMASNRDSLVTEAGGIELDWIELRNTADFDIDVSGWYLHDKPDKAQSKWEKIVNRCVVPANGYAIVWADKDYTGFTTNEAYTPIGISTSGEDLALATPGGKEIDRVSFGKQIKNVSLGLGHVERVALSSTATAEYRLDNGEWTAVNGPIGMSGGARSGFTCVTYFANTTINNADEAERFVADPTYWARPPVTNVSETIAFVGNNGGTAADFTYGGFPGGSADNMIMIVTGSVHVPRAGQWTFAAGSDDGFTAVLSRLGQTWAWEYPNTRSHAETHSTFSLPVAGDYAVRLLYFDKSGGKTFDVSVREGDHAFTEGGFNLLGSVESGIVHAGALGGCVAADLTETMQGKFDRADWRADFTLAEAPAADDVFRLRMRYADGFTATLNGTVVATVPASTARNPAAALTYAFFDIPVGVLKAGVNHLEVTGINNAIDDADFFLSPEIVWRRGAAEFVHFLSSTPGAANGDSGLEAPTPEVQFSVPHGYKTEAFALELSCTENPSAEIHYTLDGTSPTVTSPRYTEPITIDCTTVVRAAVPNASSVLQSDTSATYLFLADVMTQNATPPAGFPADGAANGQKMAYGLDADIVAQSRDKMLRGFTNSIDTISIVIDPANLFDVSKGIYVNATGDGRPWERATMVELISPTNTTDGGFCIAAGLRIRGAYSRGAIYPKHSFRFFFRSEYGASALEYPMFGSEGVAKFDKLDLRAAQNNAWANDDAYAKDFTFIEDCYSRDAQRDLGEPYQRGRYYNLFINGVYWGVYMTEERMCADYGETYFGGVAADYDVVRTSQPGYVTGIVDGTDDAWHAFWDISVNQGYGADYPDNYMRVLGLNPDGTRNASYPAYLNPRNVMVHMLTAHYSADMDAPAAGDKANNMAAIYNRAGTGSLVGWVFNRHDSEHSLGCRGSRASNDQTFYGTDAKNEVFLQEKNFNPAELNYKLMANAEYRTAFGDLVYRECLRPGGAFTVPQARARFEKRMAELDDAVVCESARWGWGKYTYDTWTNACQARLTFIENRLSYLIDDYREHGWYPSIDPPVAVDDRGVALTDGTRVASASRVYLTGGANGTVYYTTDGSDPRLAGGAVSASATAYTGGSPVGEYATAFGRNATWHFFDWGAEPANDAAGRAWFTVDYDEACDGAKPWGAGAGTLGFQSGTQNPLGTTVAKFAGHATSGTQVYAYYFRRSFDLPAAAATSTSLKLNVFYDDGYVLYVNGVEVDRVNLVASGVGYDTFANGAATETTERTLVIPAGLLKAGANVIAAEVHQNQGASSDIYWDLGLSYAVAPDVTSGGFAVSSSGLNLTMRIRTADGEWSALETVSLLGEQTGDYAAPTEAVRVAAVMSSTADGKGDGSEWIVLTNITTRPVALNGVRVTCAKTKGGVTDDPKCDFTFAGGEEIPAHGSIVVAKADYWPDGKITNGEVEMRVYADDGTVIQSLYFSADWWGGACDGTGEHFVAKAFGAEVREQTQWTTSFTVPTEAPGAAVLNAVAAAGGDLMREWLASVAADEAGRTKLAAFNGTAETVRQCYLVNVPPETDPEIEVTIPSITIGADGFPVVGGVLSLHQTPTPSTVNGQIRLYHATSLEALKTTTDFVPLGQTFPVAPTPVETPQSSSRFFQLRVE